MSAIQQLLTEHLDIWTAADTGPKSGRGRSAANAAKVYGVSKLRELILELAVRGKLVPQDASDEPASELLKRIQAEKAKLVAEGKLKKGKPLSNLSNEEKPFSIPLGWEWVRLGSTGNIFNGNSINESEKLEKYTNLKSGLPFIATKDVGYGRDELNYKNGVLIPIENEDFKIAHKGSVLICSEGGSAGKKIGLSDVDICFGNKLYANEVLAGISPRFIFYVYQSPYFFKDFSGRMTGIIGGISINQFLNIPCPIPSQNEQNRIVAKVDELMALCDQLESEHNNATEAHDKLVSHLLGTLTQSQSAEDFSANWQRIATHFDTLFTTEASIAALKQTLLQLAVLGKLVPQDPNDEPASELLKHLSVDAKKYAAELNISPPKPEPIPDANSLGIAPEGWVWTRLCSIFRVITDGDHQPPPKAEDGVAFLTIGNITTGRLDFSGCRFVPREYFESVSGYRRPEYGDILYTVVGATYGRPVFVDSHQEFCVQRHIAILKCSEHLDVKFACHLLSSQEVYEQATQCTTGTAQPTIPLRPLRNFLILLPPLAEQHRIVAKVDELMTLCDQLKSHLTEAGQLQQKLADVLVVSAVSVNGEKY